MQTDSETNICLRSEIKINLLSGYQIKADFARMLFFRSTQRQAMAMNGEKIVQTPDNKKFKVRCFVEFEEMR